MDKEEKMERIRFCFKTNCPKCGGYRTKIIANSTIAWQEASLQMLSRLSPSYIEIDVE